MYYMEYVANLSELDVESDYDHTFEYVTYSK